jgi:membrane fusion protein, heavy metal efflux system
MKFLPQTKIAEAVATAALILAAGCGRSGDATAPTVDPGTNASGPPTIQLSGGQLSSIKIGALGMHSFPVEKEAVGNIFFDEDPNIVQAESTLIGAAAAEELSTKVLARARELYDTNGVSRAELDQNTATEKTARAALKAARDAVRALGETDDDIDQMIAAGRVESARGVHGQPTWVQAYVHESDSPQIQVGQRVKVRVAAFPNEIFTGTVSKIYATVDSNTHQVTVRAAVDDANNKLRVGMLATTVIEVSNPVEATAIPANGVVREGDGTMTAWVTTDRSHFIQRVIKIGLQNDGMDQVLDGLQPGELVVTDGAIFIDNMLQAPPDDD